MLKEFKSEIPGSGFSGVSFRERVFGSESSGVSFPGVRFRVTPKYLILKLTAEAVPVYSCVSRFDVLLVVALLGFTIQQLIFSYIFNIFRCDKNKQN